LRCSCKIRVNILQTHCRRPTKRSTLHWVATSTQGFSTILSRLTVKCFPNRVHCQLFWVAIRGNLREFGALTRVPATTILRLAVIVQVAHAFCRGFTHEVAPTVMIGKLSSAKTCGSESMRSLLPLLGFFVVLLFFSRVSSSGYEWNAHEMERINSITMEALPVWVLSFAFVSQATTY
jgi:hypothetical protein